MSGSARQSIQASHDVRHDPSDRFVNALEAHGCSWRGHAYKGVAQCPAHDDSNPSLTFEEGCDGRVILHCHAGCDPHDVVRALDLAWGDLFPDDHHRAPATRRPRVRAEQPIVSMLTLLPAAGIKYGTTGNPDLLIADHCPACSTPALWIYQDHPGLRVSCARGCDLDRVLEALKQRATGAGVRRAA